MAHSSMLPSPSDLLIALRKGKWNPLLALLSLGHRSQKTATEVCQPK